VRSCEPTLAHVFLRHGTTATAQTKNGTGRTYGHYKPIVRMFKNARRYLVEKGRLANGLAPSYFIECLLYNVPDHLFTADRQAAMRGILEWLLASNKNGFGCQNGQVPLFGPTPEQWNPVLADQLINARDPRRNGLALAAEHVCLVGLSLRNGLALAAEHASSRF